MVDFAHAWAEKCLEKIELEELTGEDEYSAGFWKKLLIGGTLDQREPGRAAANSAFFDSDSTELGGGGDGYISSQPSARNEMRYQAIRQAVNEGLLPESALSQLDMYDDETEDSSNVHDEERLKVKYNYVLFHIIFFLATQYVATLLTINVQQDDLGDFVPVGRTYFSSCVKIISSWVCYVLYGWSLVAPSIWPERFGVSL
ncbi:hypothetical protein QCA50_018765 [Cerrena zonata]|uniref:Uncharacterized protein n=1 Tax=Cerrena zonata TaxID=2478898 RepID=A0AAW0FH02_9APHY